MMSAFEQDIKNCISTLNNGGSILYPTDTIWGLGCDATDETAVDRIAEIKNRPPNKSFIVLIADVEMLEQYLSVNTTDLEKLVAAQEGATTIIFDNIHGIAVNALAADGSLGIRIPKDDFCLALLKEFGKPIISTSANLGGEPNPTFYKEIGAEVKNRVDYTVGWRQDDNEPKQPSSIIKLNADGTFTKIR